MDHKIDAITIGVGFLASVGIWYLWSYFKKEVFAPDPQNHTPARRQTSNPSTSSNSNVNSQNTEKVMKPKDQPESCRNQGASRLLNNIDTDQNDLNKRLHTQHKNEIEENIIGRVMQKTVFGELSSSEDLNASTLTGVQRISDPVEQVTKEIMQSIFKVDSTEVPSTTYNCTSAMKPEVIVFGPEGCAFFSPYLRWLIPKGAVANSTEISITPHYECQIDLDGRMHITAVIEFQAPTEIKFLKNVQVQLYTPYSAAKSGKPVTVEIMRMRHDDNYYHPIEKAELDQDSWIPFWTKQMCRLCAALPLADRAHTKKRYYSAAIARDTTQQHHRVISWMVCEDMPNNREINKEYFEAQDSRKVIDAEKFEIGYEYNLRLRLQSQGKRMPPGVVDNNPNFTVEIDDEVVEIALHQKYNIGFDEKSVLYIGTNEENKFVLKLRYQVYAIGFDSDMRDRNIFDKACYLDWSTKQGPVTVVNATGKRSTGIKMNVDQPQAPALRHRTSGYGTNIRNIANIRDESSRPAFTSSSSFSDPLRSEIISDPLKSEFTSDPPESDICISDFSFPSPPVDSFNTYSTGSGYSNSYHSSDWKMDLDEPQHQYVGEMNNSTNTENNLADSHRDSIKENENAFFNTPPKQL